MQFILRRVIFISGWDTKGEIMTLYEAMTNEIENLVTLGRADVPGIREKLFIEAEELREKRDALTVGEANKEFAGAQWSPGLF